MSQQDLDVFEIADIFCKVPLFINQKSKFLTKCLGIEAATETLLISQLNSGVLPAHEFYVRALQNWQGRNGGSATKFALESKLHQNGFGEAAGTYLNSESYFMFTFCLSSVC